MRSKFFIGMIVTAVVCLVLSQIQTALVKDSKRDFQKTLEEKENSYKTESPIAHKDLLDDGQELTMKHEESIFPTQEEIDFVNSKLPVMISEGLLFSQIEYNEKTKVQTFHYRVTQEVDESMITNDVISQLKKDVASDIKKFPNSVRRIKAGVTYRYIYSTVENRKLYEIKIDAKDLK